MLKKSKAAFGSPFSFALIRPFADLRLLAPAAPAMSRSSPGQRIGIQGGPGRMGAEFRLKTQPASLIMPYSPSLSDEHDLRAYRLHKPPFTTGAVMHPTPSEPQRLVFSCAEVRAVLGIGHKSLNALLESGALHHVKSGRKRLIPRQALVEFLAKPS